MQVDTSENTDTCVLCEGPLDTAAEMHNALQAAYWSTIVSVKGTKLGK